MGQYFIIVNMTKKEFIHPHKFGDGLKLMEFGCSSNGTMTALALLLRQSSEGGGGDFPCPEKYKIVGSWAGDKIVIVGDYDESGLYDIAIKTFTDISKKVLYAFNGDIFLKNGKEIINRSD